MQILGNITNAKIYILVVVVVVLYFYGKTAKGNLTKFWYEGTWILETGFKLHYTAITNIHEDSARIKTIK